MAELVHGFALGVRDVPQRGLMVRVTPAMFGGADLEPAEAAELGQALIAQAEEAVHASRARRRLKPCGDVCPAITATTVECGLDEGHIGKHAYFTLRW